MSSDSSDEENLEHLREAQDSQFIKDSMFSDKPEKSVEEGPSSQKKDVLPSQRKVVDADAQFNFLKVTPEFRNHVAKKLSKILDNQLEESLTNTELIKSSKIRRVKSGVKLLSDSKHFLKPSKKVNKPDPEVIRINSSCRIDRYKKLKVEVPEESLKEVAVTSEDILSGKEVETWSTRSKAPVYRYKKSKNGQLALVE